jgi:hypothetical protein
MTGSATGSTTFVLNAVYGAETIANLTGSDIVRNRRRGGVAVVKAGDGDTLTLAGITQSTQLQGLSGDFTFHA